MGHLFLSCLQPHKFDLHSYTVHFKGGLKVYVGAVFDDTKITTVPDPRKLLSGSGDIMRTWARGLFVGSADCQSRYLYWRDSHALGNLRDERILLWDVRETLTLLLPSKVQCDFIKSDEPFKINYIGT